MNRKFLLIVLPFLAFGAPDHASAQEKEFPAYNCAITPPAGWNTMEDFKAPQGFATAFANADRTGILILLVDDPRKSAGSMDERFVSEFERGIVDSGGGDRVSGGFIEIAGVKGYERFGRIVTNGKTVSSLTRAVIADRRVFSVSGILVDGDVSKDPALQSAVASFRFLHPPDTSVSAEPEPTASYRAGVLVGRILVIALIVAIVYKLVTFRRKK